MEDDDLPILFVDDEPNVLDGIRRMLFDSFDIVTADSGEEALQFIASDGPFSVVVSDMRMPNMDGAELLSRVKILAPDTTRILLTGYSEVDAAVKAINDGQIFRFLSKPCSRELLIRALTEGVRQYKLLTGERILLEQTLGGAVDVMVSVLELSSPLAFSRARRVRRCAAHLAKDFGLMDAWQLELAALLSSLGCITVPQEVLDKVDIGEQLSAVEERLYSRHPIVAYNLLNNIPRLREVALLVLHQTTTAEKDLPPSLELHRDLLRTSIAYTLAIDSGLDIDKAKKQLRRQGFTDTKALAALSTLPLLSPESCTKLATLKELKPGMVLEQDVVTPKGGIVVPQGREVTAALIERLGNFAMGLGIVEPIKVLVHSAPASANDSAASVAIPLH